jgi:predicted ATPase/DNA-binding CsgD family transcriptional regulator
LGAGIINTPGNTFQAEPLTEREFDILTLMADGFSNAEIAERLVIGLETVRWYTKQIYTKLDVHSRTQASMRARDLGLLGHEAAVRPPSQTAAPRQDLPVYSTPFIGRDAEMGELGALLNNPQVRLMTLVGPGGMGKTRLAVELARAQAAQFPRGVFYIPLACIQSVDEIELAIASSIQLRLPDDKAPREQLLQYLAGQQLLLVLDSFEHILAGTELVSAILGTASGVKIIVTSFVSLNLREEWVRNLDALPVPASDDLPDTQAYGAIQLFCDCVRRVRGDFLLEDHLPAVIHICRMVQGMPLAIELAAAWLKTLSAEDVAKEIQHNIDFLATTQSDIEARHRSIQAVFEHSWNLLTADEQHIFRRLSVFRGGFGLAAAQQVAGASVQILSELVGKSLLQQQPNGLYHIHALLREYGERKLMDADVNMLSMRSVILHTWAALVRGKFDKVEQVAKANLATISDQGASVQKAFALGALGMLAGIEGDYERAQQLGEASLTLPTDDIISALIARLGLSIAACGAGNYASAKHDIRLALRQAAELRIPAFGLLCLPVIAIIMTAETLAERAVELLALAFTHPDSTLDWIKRWQLLVQTEADLEAELGKQGYAAAWERGKYLELEQVTAALLAEF